MRSDFIEPLNVASDEMVSINELMTVVEEIAGVKRKRSYNIGAPKGLRDPTAKCSAGRRLREGMEKTYRWIYYHVKARAEVRPFVTAYE